jgi:hypothetical protein
LSLTCGSMIRRSSPVRAAHRPADRPTLHSVGMLPAADVSKVWLPAWFEPMCRRQRLDYMPAVLLYQPRRQGHPQAHRRASQPSRKPGRRWRGAGVQAGGARVRALSRRGRRTVMSRPPAGTALACTFPLWTAAMDDTRARPSPKPSCRVRSSNVAAAEFAQALADLHDPSVTVVGPMTVVAWGTRPR